MKKVTLLHEHSVHVYTYRVYLIAEGVVGYVVITCNNELDFGQCMCCWSSSHDEMGAAIMANRSELSKVTICGTYSKYNLKLGADATFDDLTTEEVTEIKAKITSLRGEIDRELKSHKLNESNVAAVRKLIRELRYEDARAHCTVCGLSFEGFLDEARKSHMPSP